MIKKLFRAVYLFNFTLIMTKEPELPLCPTNVLYFPQNLPMHCRMPTSADFPGISGPLPTVPPFYHSLPTGKQPSMPMPPGVPGPMSIPGMMTLPGTMAIPGSSAPIPYPGPIPLPPGQAQKLPVIVMPFYSPDPSFKKTERPNYPRHSFRPSKWKIRHRHRRPVIYSSPDKSSSTDTELSSETSSSSSSEYQGWWKGRRNYRRFNQLNRIKMRNHKQKRQLLTPVLQYVTKDGYVIYEKKISKNEAKDWLNVKKDEKVEDSIRARVVPEAREMESNEPNNNYSGQKETATEDNGEVMTKRNIPRLNRIKSYRNRAARKKIKVPSD